MKRVRPVRAGVAAVLRVAPQLAPKVEKLLWRGFYEVISLGPGDPETTLMNYGYVPGSPEAPERSDDHARTDHGEARGLALYEAVAGAVDLSGLDVLEVSSGRGGGTAFVFERFAPRSIVGLDLARQAVSKARRRYGGPAVRFVAGDAEHLPFPDDSFDAVLSVEATHCYSDASRFLREAFRVLRPSGVLLLADFRHTALLPETQDALIAQEDVQILRDQLAATGFRTREEEDITAGVVRALELDTPRRRARIERRAPRPLRPYLLAFAAIEGSPMYEAFAQRKWTYLRYVLEKPAITLESPVPRSAPAAVVQ